MIDFKFNYVFVYNYFKIKQYRKFCSEYNKKYYLKIFKDIKNGRIVRIE